MAAELGTCRYCGEEKLLGNEHAFPGWVYRCLGIENTPAVRHVDGVPVGAPAPLEVVALHEICDECNRAWSDHEQKISKWLCPSMRNAPIPFALDFYQRRRVAAWAVKTGLMLELALRQQQREFFAPESQFAWLHDHVERLEPPPGCRVWMFGVEVENAWPATTTVALLKPARPDFPEAYLATFTIGYLGFQVFGPDVVKTPDARWVMAPPLDPPPAFQTVLSRIWPDADIYRHPPDEVIRIADIAKLASWPQVVLGLSRA
jgi:hypothetical protein